MQRPRLQIYPVRRLPGSSARDFRAMDVDRLWTKLGGYSGGHLSVSELSEGLWKARILGSLERRTFEAKAERLQGDEDGLTEEQLQQLLAQDLSPQSIVELVSNLDDEEEVPPPPPPESAQEAPLGSTAPHPEVEILARRCRKMEGMDTCLHKVMHGCLERREQAYRTYEDANEAFFEAILTADFERLSKLIDDHDDIDAVAWAQRQRDKRYTDGVEVLRGVVEQLESVLKQIEDARMELQEDLRRMGAIPSSQGSKTTERGDNPSPITATGGASLLAGSEDAQGFDAESNMSPSSVSDDAQKDGNAAPKKRWKLLRRIFQRKQSR